ncbi:hypothetical protein MHAE_08498 [Mycobacterium haemophilum DSM 44634]|uniref:phage major capsid protein n=1 Tax=Mycobacterium haemophilum TaxID=29311 RepID=UPI000655E4FE|nr:phage major capsid protein [Mycobacterium haemophilum]AKN15685.1 hypothetical protein B586_02490 [Mycobacterium haemophilum DSM 44634]MCV7341231.1 phage major capsid protein [Mycobacterium haemophilum DSM 44634]
MTARTTSTSAYAWRPDEVFFAANEVVGPALILRTSTIAGTVEGDTPVVRCAYVNDAEAAYVAEAATISESDPGLAEVTVATKKIAQLVKISNEQYRQAQTATQLAQSVSRALIKKADRDYVTSVSNPVGLANITGTVEAGTISTDLDGLIDLVAALESNGAQPSHILMDPMSWAEFRKLKVGGVGTNESLLGAGTTDAASMLLNLPVIVNRFIAPSTGAVLDRSAVVSAVGPVSVATSEHAAFSSDSVLLRATWRIGWNIVRPNWVGSFDIGGGS